MNLVEYLVLTAGVPDGRHGLDPESGSLAPDAPKTATLKSGATRPRPPLNGGLQ